LPAKTGIVVTALAAGGVGRILGSRETFYGSDQDVSAFGQFIQRYITQFDRWNSPKFLYGESYGTTRSAALADHLLTQRGIALNGVILQSSILNFGLDYGNGDPIGGGDWPYVLYLPTEAATAWYHHKLAPDLQKDLKTTLREVEQFASTEYLEALAKGNKLTQAERQQIAEKLSRFTGLDKKFVDESDLRIEIFHFTNELLRDRKRTVGRIDSRFEGIDESGVSDRPDYDPSIAVIRPPSSTPGRTCAPS